MIGGGHTLIGQRLDSVRLSFFLFEADPGSGNLPAKFVEILFHSAQFGFRRRLRVPLYNCADQAIDCLIGFDAEKVGDERKRHEEPPTCWSPTLSIRIRAFGG